MNRPKALFLDIDGTILRSNHSLSDRVASAITSLKSTGTIVCLATGRSWESLKPLYDRLGLDGPTVCYNGAVIVEGPEGRILFEKDMDEKTGRAVIEEARFRNLEMVAYRNSQLVYERVGPNIEAYHTRTGLRGTIVDFDSLEILEFTKAIILSEPENLVPVREVLVDRFPSDCLSAVYSGPRFLEFMGGGLDKGKGLVEVCRLHEVPISSTVAMGDGWNDLALLEAAGDAWVMGGAPEDLKSRFPANRIAPHADEDGAAQVIEALLEGQEPFFGGTHGSVVSGIAKAACSESGVESIESASGITYKKQKSP